MEVFITTLIHTNILQKHTAVLNILINFKKKILKEIVQTHLFQKYQFRLSNCLPVYHALKFTINDKANQVISIDKIFIVFHSFRCISYPLYSLICNIFHVNLHINSYKMLTMTGTVKILSIKVKVMSHIVSIMNYVAYDFLINCFIPALQLVKIRGYTGVFPLFFSCARISCLPR